MILNQLSNTSLKIKNAQIITKETELESLNRNSSSVLLSLDVNNLESLKEKLNNYSNCKFNSNLIDLGSLIMQSGVMHVVNDLLTTYKCKLLLLIKDNSLIKNIFEAAELHYNSLNIQYISPGGNSFAQFYHNFSQRLKSSIFNVGFSCTQQHLHDISADHLPSYFDSYRLGLFKQDPSFLEQSIDYANVTILDANVIKQADFPGKSQVSTSGITSEDFNNLLYYCGKSARNRLTVIYGFGESSELDTLSLDTFAQSLHYYASGLETIKDASSIETTYIVENVEPYERIKFIKNEINGAWKVKYPKPLTGYMSVYNIIPCVYEDYKVCAGGELTSRLYSIFKRIENSDQ